MDLRYVVDDRSLDAGRFLALARRCWRRSAYDETRVAEALTRTLNVTAWRGDELIGCLRVLHDGYFFATIPELMVDPAVQRRGIGSKLLALGAEACPVASIYFGSQPGNEAFFEANGAQPGLPAFTIAKRR